MAHFIIIKTPEYSEIEYRRVAWDLLKFDIQCKSIEIGIKNVKEKRELEHRTLQLFNEVYAKLCDTGLDGVEEQEYAESKKILDDINAYKERGPL